MIRYAIGDIHGCNHQMLDILGQINADAVKHDQPFEIVFLGDYIDRGPQSNDVIQNLMALEQRYPDMFIFLKGNHEDIALNDWSCWQNNGGIQTLNSYPDRIMPPEHYDWMENLPLFYETDNHIFCHAGVADDPFVQMSEQTEESLLWMRYPNNYNPHIDKIVVHGHTPKSSVEMLSNRLNLDTGCVFGGWLTAAKFETNSRQPVEFFKVKGYTK